ncbi:MAG: hypothetical protein ACJ04O_11015, partial [Cellvibrionales bacterium]
SEATAAIIRAVDEMPKFSHRSIDINFDCSHSDSTNYTGLPKFMPPEVKKTTQLPDRPYFLFQG